MTRFLDLLTKIEQWSVDRGLDGADCVKQAKKLKEEFGELVGADIKGKRDVLMDSIGDMLVVMVIYCQQTGINRREVFSLDGFEKHLFGEALLADMDYQSACLYMESVRENHKAFRRVYLNQIFRDLVALCQERGIAILDCLSMAYDAIKDRKGKLVNGAFIKSEDLNA